MPVRPVQLVPLILFAAVAVAPRAGAQTAPPGPGALPPGPPVLDTAPLLTRPVLPAVQPGTWRYSLQVARNGQSMELAQRTVTVEAAPGNADAWRVIDETNAHGQLLGDTVLLARRDLHPLQRRASLGPVRLSLDFDADSVRGLISAPAAPPVPVTLPMSPAVVANGASLETLLTTLPLADDWAATVLQVAPSPVGVSLALLTLRVIGEDSVEVPAGRFAVWVVRVSSGDAQQAYWLARDSGRLIGMLVTPPQSPDVRYLTVLTAAEPAGAAGSVDARPPR